MIDPLPEGPEEQKEKHQQQGVNACLARHRAMFVQVFAVEKFQENRQSLQRIDDGQQRRERADEQCEFLPHATAPNEYFNSFRSLEMLMPERRAY